MIAESIRSSIGSSVALATLEAAPSRRRSALYELSLANTRDLARSGKTIFGVLFMFAFLLAIIAVIHLSINVQRPAPVVGIIGSSQLGDRLLSSLQEQGISARQVESAEDTDITATVEISQNSAVVALDYPHPPSWLELDRSISQLGVPSSEISVIRSNGALEVDILRVNLGAVLIAGLLAIAFLGTSVPIVYLRQRGTLRLFGTTPVSRLSFIIAQTPVRFAIGLAEAGVIVGIAAFQGYVRSFDLARLSVTLVIGLAMLFSLAYLLAARSTNPEVIGQISGLIPVLVVLTSGTMLPTQGFPDFVIAIMNSFPTTWLMQAVSADVAGTTPFVSVYALWAMMGAVTLGCGLLAARVFRWNQGE